MSNDAVPSRDGALDVRWDLSDLVGGRPDDAAGPVVDELLDDADRRSEALAEHRGGVASWSAAELARFMVGLDELQDVLGRVESYAALRFATDLTDPARGALVQRVQERATAVRTRLLWFELEWAMLDDEAAESLLGEESSMPFRHHLRAQRRYRDHLLSEPEERVLAEKAQSGQLAWARLFSDLTATIEVELDTRTVSLDEGLSRLHAPDAEVRRAAHAAVTAALAPGLRTRAFLFNTILLDKAVDDRLRSYPSWISSRNLANEASDESVRALIDAVVNRYDLPQRWYSLKARVFGVERIADYDRNASLAEDEETVPFGVARDLVLDCYASFSPALADIARRFFDERWIDAPALAGKEQGAFCSYTVPSAHPYVLLNYTDRREDVLTLAHELGHGLHGWLARDQGVFQQSTPLTLAETASVFGETVVFGRLLAEATTPASRLALLAEHIEGAIATVFRQTAMSRFEDAVHRARRGDGELSVERFGELWVDTQAEMLGSAVEITEGYRSWWSYIPHFIGVPGYVYAYAYGQLLALAVYKQYQEQGADFVPRYLHLLSAGGSMAPEDLGRIVGCDLADPAFWDGGLALIEKTIDDAETAAVEAGRIR